MLRPIARTLLLPGPSWVGESASLHLAVFLVFVCLSVCLSVFCRELHTPTSSPLGQKLNQLQAGCLTHMTYIWTMGNIFALTAQILELTV